MGSIAVVVTFAQEVWGREKKNTNQKCHWTSYSIQNVNLQSTQSGFIYCENGIELRNYHIWHPIIHLCSWDVVHTARIVTYKEERKEEKKNSIQLSVLSAHRPSVSP